MNLLLVGSFNPPTVGHLRMLEIGRDIIGGAKDDSICIVSPVADSYKKEGLICIEDRMEMLKISCLNNDLNIIIDSWEAIGDGGRWKKTRETVEYLNIKYSSLTLIVGGDLYNGLINEDIWPDEDVLLFRVAG